MKQRRTLRILSTVLLVAAVGSCAPLHQHHRDGTLGAATNAFPELAIVRGEVSSAGVVLVLSDDLFVEELELKASAQRDLAAISGYLKQHPGERVVIASAAAAGNADMRQRRGTAVEAFFLKSGVDPQRVEMRAAPGSMVTTRESARSRPAPAGARNSL